MSCFTVDTTTDPGRDGWKYYGFTGYKLIDTAATYDAAVMECESHSGSQLMEINSAHEEDVVLYVLEYMRQRGNNLQSTFLGEASENDLV